MIVSKTRNAPGWATQGDNLIPNGVKCNENVIWVSVLRLGYSLCVIAVYEKLQYVWFTIHMEMVNCEKSYFKYKKMIINFIDWGTNYQLRLKCPNCTCICKWTEQVLCFLIDVLIELFYVSVKLS